MQLKISSSSSSGRIYSVSVKIKPRIMHKFPEWNKLINCWVQDDAIINNSELYINLWLFAQKLQTPIRISCSIKFLTTAKIWRLQCWESWKYNFQFAFWTNYGQIRKLWLETCDLSLWHTGKKVKRIPAAGHDTNLQDYNCINTILVLNNTE